MVMKVLFDLAHKREVVLFSTAVSFRTIIWSVSELVILNPSPKAWKHYLKTCERLGYQPEAAVETNLLQQYKTLYTRYCKDHGLLFDPSRNELGWLTTFSINMYMARLICIIDSQPNSSRRFTYKSSEKLCIEFGCESIIQIRRAMYMLMEKVVNQPSSDDNYLLYFVGSRAEGFRITSSDTESCIAVVG
jgi:hypothetical protein